MSAFTLDSASNRIAERTPPSSPPPPIPDELDDFRKTSPPSSSFNKSQAHAEKPAEHEHIGKLWVNAYLRDGLGFNIAQPHYPKYDLKIFCGLSKKEFVVLLTLLANLKTICPLRWRAAGKPELELRTRTIAYKMYLPLTLSSIASASRDGGYEIDAGKVMTLAARVRRLPHRAEWTMFFWNARRFEGFMKRHPPSAAMMATPCEMLETLDRLVDRWAAMYRDWKTKQYRVESKLPRTLPDPAFRRTRRQDCDDRHDWDYVCEQMDESDDGDED